MRRTPDKPNARIGSNPWARVNRDEMIRRGFVRPSHASILYGIDENKVRYWIKFGYLSVMRLGTGVWIRRADLARLVAIAEQTGSTRPLDWQGLPFALEPGPGPGTHPDPHRIV